MIIPVYGTSPHAASFHRPLRYTHVTGQADWYTCGAAAVSTLLTYYYGDPASEQDVLDIAFAETQASGKDPLEGLTALSLKRALEQRGYNIKAYRVNLEQLADYFRRGGLPVVGHVTKPQLHFLVIAGVLDPPGGGPTQVLLADPSWGRRIVPLSELVVFKGFSGVILLAVPKSQAQLRKVRTLQTGELAWAARELARLRSLRRRLP
ncbi:cysteine peptidase family C39 domain-containing protein [Oceanithermus sp.]|uniref:C39 family peptidase n=1 Tax=Oceanithermus sp. TaxID=2268145 RepID=UPI00257BB649|nr:cysteine peptidase family C39 domain-containing protein [Oceanithermus sp.]